MLDINKIFPIGIGTWGIGGFMQRDNSINEAKQVESIGYMINQGMNFVQANMWYSEGYAVEILAKALRTLNKKREDLFICQAIYLREGKTLEESKKELNRVLELFETNYIDTVQFSSESFYRSSFDEITDWIDSLIENNLIRYTSITNADLSLLKKYHEKYKEKLFSHEVMFNFEIRENEDVGIIPYMVENKIRTVVYQPLRRNRTAKRDWPILIELSEKYGKTQNQILLNWIISKEYLPLTKSESIEHINEHIDALNFSISAEDLKRLDAFRVPGYKSPQIDWKYQGVGVTPDQLSNVFDDNYNKLIGI
jgi:diketogulonate reductase-like aldo/keto reductase